MGGDYFNAERGSETRKGSGQSEGNGMAFFSEESSNQHPSGSGTGSESERMNGNGLGSVGNGNIRQHANSFPLRRGSSVSSFPDYSSLGGDNTINNDQGLDVDPEQETETEAEPHHFTVKQITDKAMKWVHHEQETLFGPGNASLSTGMDVYQGVDESMSTAGYGAWNAGATTTTPAAFALFSSNLSDTASPLEHQDVVAPGSGPRSSSNDSHQEVDGVVEAWLIRETSIGGSLHKWVASQWETDLVCKSLCW